MILKPIPITLSDGSIHVREGSSRQESTEEKIVPKE